MALAAANGARCSRAHRPTHSRISCSSLSSLQARPPSSWSASLCRGACTGGRRAEFVLVAHCSDNPDRGTAGGKRLRAARGCTRVQPPWATASGWSQTHRPQGVLVLEHVGFVVEQTPPGRERPERHPATCCCCCCCPAAAARPLPRPLLYLLLRYCAACAPRGSAVVQHCG
jgi:hypothetical protein